MINKAIEKMTMECEELKDHKYYEVYVAIEEYYTGCITEKIAKKILQECKTIKEAYGSLREYARTNNLEYMSDKRGFSIIDKYFGITQEDYSSKSRTPAAEDDMDDILDLM